jgi:adenylate cyclase
MILTVLSSGGFFTLVRFIKEKKRSEHIATLFSKYVHKDVLKELMKSPESINLTGEKRYLTVLFSDLRGFTTLSESLSPEELTTVLNGYFSAMTPAVLEEHGTIDKYIGDAIMAFWNAPLEVKNHERHAVISALRMQEDLKKFNKEHNTTLAVGVGIHAGNAVVGNVGSKERVNYTVLGDTVNLASRVEGLTKKYGVEVLVTEEVKDKVDDEGILFRKLDIITVKGKNLPTVLYEAMRMDTSRVSVIKAYDEAFLKYQNGEFEKAKELFKALADKGDIPGEKMYERIMNLGEVHNWDGVWHFDEK